MPLQASQPQPDPTGAQARARPRVWTSASTLHRDGPMHAAKGFRNPGLGPWALGWALLHARGGKAHAARASSNSWAHEPGQGQGLCGAGSHARIIRGGNGGPRQGPWEHTQVGHGVGQASRQKAEPEGFRFPEIWK